VSLPPRVTLAASRLRRSLTRRVG